MEIPKSCPCGWKAVGPSDYLDHRCEITQRIWDARNCQHKDVKSLLLMDTEDHIVLCRDCRTVIHWCNDTEDQWRDLENSRSSEAITRETLER